MNQQLKISWLKKNLLIIRSEILFRGKPPKRGTRNFSNVSNFLR
ncbi:Uncharacterized protein dnm_065130 [Desulfonema magnum]|uniref:Uncharacterized protein n=1 Tax=Desulfonema magnum TaxID=45655 RepID=A0A975BS61_9BACT|nr:Uncharacterized protein dnm_065130 [Desulfonema magnum]